MPQSSPLILRTDRGLYCPPGDFYIDAWRPVERTIITHAHSDHARRGSGRYLTASDGAHVLRRRLGDDISADPLEYGQAIEMNGVRISLHPAGHVLGSAQARIEHRGEVWVVSGDYKLQQDPTCRAFEPVRCHTFITECTFGLPVFRWEAPEAVAAQINGWWRDNREAGRTSILLAYSLGKAQRVMSLLDPSVGPILLHGAVVGLVDAYRRSGVALPPAEYASAEVARRTRGQGAIVIAPPGAVGSPWIRKFAPFSTGVASGWMRVRGFRRRKGVDRGFVLSDHTDWPGLLETIEATGAETVIATHGYTETLVRFLTERGKHSYAIPTHFKGEGAELEEAGEEDASQVTAAAEQE